MASSSVPLTGRQSHLPPPRTATPRSQALAAAPLVPIALLFYSTLLPQEVRVSLAGQVIYPYRAATFILLPWLINRIVTGRLPFRAADLWMLTGVAWMVVSFVAFYGMGEGISRGGALALDVIAPYLIARVCVRSFDDLRRLLVIAAPGLFLAGAGMMVESITHRQLVRPMAAAIFGPLPYFENGQAVATAKDFNVVRLGLLRAAGPFSHPILAGLFLASVLPLFINSALMKWPRKLGIAAGLMAIFSVSSAAFLSFIITGVLLGYDWFQTQARGIGWRFFIFCLSALILIVQVGSQNGVVPILVRYTLDPATGWFRQLIWEYGTRSVAKHPWFGIGFTDYERLPWMINSIDNHWLLLAVRHGYITPICIFLSCVVGIFSLSRMSVRVAEKDRKFAVGICVALTGLVLSGFTTSYFGGTLTWFSMLIATTLSLGDIRTLRAGPAIPRELHATARGTAT